VGEHQRTMSAEGWNEVTIEWRGKTVKGAYCVSGQLVTVAAWTGTKTAQLGLLPAEKLAKMLLRELVFEEGDKKP
jgi:hypothetical protein